MTYPFPYGGITVTVERPTFDRFNDATYVEHHTIPDCIEFPSGSTEAAPNVGISDLRSLLIPAGSDVLAIDRIVFHQPGSLTPPAAGTALRRANTYQVIGRPKDWIHAMTGWHPGQTVDLEKIT
jgi:hypothetical protein